MAMLTRLKKFKDDCGNQLGLNFVVSDHMENFNMT